MYFPYVRGRQYELLALKELASKKLIGDRVIPIIEPVKLSSTLINTISEYVGNGRKLCLLLNPEVGNFLSECKKAQPNSKEKGWCDLFDSFCDSNVVIPSLTMNIDTKSFLENRNHSNFLIIHRDSDFLDDYRTLFDEMPPKYNLIPDERIFKRNTSGERVLFIDKFAKKNRNADYAKKNDEDFSDEHLFFKTEGYVGFSDYSVIGDAYVEAGFAPYAVAIHIVYFDSTNRIKVRHFVSDSNDDIENPAGKFYEALTKLNDWHQSQTIPPKTLGIEAFLEHFRNKTYPGLGTSKKLALMHHLELMSQYFERTV